ncbi:hypothetical protein [Acidicapsa ligni]|uniref:hypothetical protein n=1 Tax=Acidicapsa ligni TaxID=542300 RepID=UPI0021E0D023|nr:hypothetical protein [Acidicapsa ligni]
MTESDWRIRRDILDGEKTVRVFRGPEGPDGQLEPGKSQGYWFDDSGHLIKTYTLGYEIRPQEAKGYAGVQMPRRIDLIKDGKVGARFLVKEIGPATVSPKEFSLNGHEWQRAFTAEVR